MNNIIEDFKKNKWAILFGAGVSLDGPSNIPIGSILTKYLLKNAIHKTFADKIQSFTENNFIDIQAGRFLRFEKLCELISEDNKNLGFLDFFGEFKIPNKNHYNLAGILSQGNILLTTNFDILIEIAAKEMKIKINQVSLPTKVDVEIRENTLYKLHGTILSFANQDNNKIKSTIKDVSSLKLKKQINRIIDNISQKYNLLVVGYSGYDDFDVSPAILSSFSNKKIVWVSHKNQDGYKVLDFKNLQNIKDSKYKLLLEKLYAFGTRKSKNIFVIEGNTSDLLSDLTNVPIHKEQMNNTIIDFKKK